MLDANGTTTDHQICFSKDYGTGGTTGGNYWGIGVDGSENKLVFAYDPNAQASLSADAKVVIDSSGNVGIGTTSIPTGKLAVEGGIYLSGSSNFLRFGADSSTTTGVAIHRPAANTIAFVTSSAERARVTDNGITFNGDTAAANALDDYEEGDWTPGISAVSGSGGTTGGVGRYTKIGNQVIIAGHITPTNMGSLSGTFYVTGLPFTSKNQFIQSQGAVRSQGIGGTNHQSVSFEVLQASQNGRFHFHSSTGAQLVVQASDISVGDFIAFGLTYEV